MWFGNAARDCCPGLSYCGASELARPLLSNVLPHSLTIWLSVVHILMLTYEQYVFVDFGEYYRQAKYV